MPSVGNVEDMSSSSGLVTRSDHERPPLVVADKENLAVKQSKRLVILALWVAAAVVATLVYLVASGDEHDNFIKDVETFNNEIIENTELIMREYASVLQSLSTTTTSNAVSGNQTWPNVTIPFFEIRAYEARARANMDVFVFCPLVERAQQTEWEEYAVEHQDWIRAGLDYRGMVDTEPGTISATITSFDATAHTNASLFLPVWQMGAAPENASIVNRDLLSHPHVAATIQRALQTGKTTLSPILDVQFLVEYSKMEFDDRRRLARAHEDESTEGDTSTSGSETKVEFEGEEEDETGSDGEDEKDSSRNPHALVVQPVFDTFDESKEIKGFIVAAFDWGRLFHNTEVIQHMTVVLSSSCGQVYTYSVEMFAELVGTGDLHETKYDYLHRRQEFEPFQEEWEELLHTVKNNDGSECEYTFDIYPTKELEKTYTTRYPLLYSFVVVFIFLATSLVFTLYDRMVQRRQKMVMNSAINANRIVSSIFPANVKERILQNAEEQAKKKPKQQAGYGFGARKQLTTFLDEAQQQQDEETSLLTGFATKPIADLFTEATVFFADIAGFTAWSSVREPSQVFTLLETVYAAFDKVAKTLKVFKVETVGDCYVAVAGLPIPRSDHAVVMALFATECMRRFEELSKKLEIVLGPGTGSLSLRAGLHSGPVTAGVLRGDNARFQLFGDTVNVASRMESTGEKGRIQVSQETATILLAAGKKLTLRSEKVEAKGKGLLQTYWLNLPSTLGASRHSNPGGKQGDCSIQEECKSESDIQYLPDSLLEQMERLIDWNANNLVQLLKVVQGRRSALNVPRDDPSTLKLTSGSGKMVLDEVKEIITLPKFDVMASKHAVDLSHMELRPEVAVEARTFVHEIASRYNNNPFHNFEHASHVAMSVVKLLSRIVAPEETADFEDDENTASYLHDHTYGITSDPLTCFGCVFSALIHDVEHVGIPNTQLVKENTPLARTYQSKSIAEQNSVDVAWNLLMEDRFANFRSAIFVNREELTRFRELVVNSVMATDIMDKELKQLRNGRWETAFDSRIREESMLNPNLFEQGINRKATIVIEHLIQASDVAHTMQHWHIYRKWNEKLYHEMYQAYMDGRSDADPTDGWYQGEIGFFDFYIIPLAKKLADCGVFGVSSFEYLNFAIRNREEWVLKGEQLVKEMNESVAVGN